VSLENDPEEIETVHVVDAKMLAAEKLDKKRAHSVNTNKHQTKEEGAGNKKNKVDPGVTIKTVVVKEEKKVGVSKAVIMSSSSSSTTVVKEEKPATVVAKPVLGVSLENDPEEIETVHVVDAKMLAAEKLDKKRAHSVNTNRQTKEEGAGNKKNKVDPGVTIKTVVVKEEKKLGVSKAVSAVAEEVVSKAVKGASTEEVVSKAKGQGAGKGKGKAKK
jgi:hypothetical protein